MMLNEVKVSGLDVAIENLVPLKERGINLANHTGFNKIVSSIKAIGLIEPLCVYKEGEQYVILDGYLRYKACQQLGAKLIPCMCYKDKEAYTFNKMVNRLSASQESNMLRKSLRTIDQATIANVFGIKSIQHHLGTQILKDLHPKLIKTLDKNLISRRCVSELTYVTQDRQVEILSEMEKSNDYSISLCRALIIKTPPPQRNPNKPHKKAWCPDSPKKQELVTKLEAVGKRYDFYTGLYRQYTADLVKLNAYIRKLITNEQVKNYLLLNAPDILARFEGIVFETEGKKAV